MAKPVDGVGPVDEVHGPVGGGAATDVGVELPAAFAIMAAVGDASRARKKLATEDILDGVARHQSVLEAELREHREAMKRDARARFPWRRVAALWDEHFLAPG